MVKKIDTIFDRWEFESPAEEVQSRILTLLQRAYIQNLLSDCFAEKMSIGVNLDKPDEFRLTHEYLRGQMQAYLAILTLSNEAIESLKNPEDNYNSAP